MVLRIPFAEGERHSVWRGPGEKSHSDVFNRYAVDFSPLDEGHVIVSACDGKDVFVKAHRLGPSIPKQAPTPGTQGICARRQGLARRPVGSGAQVRGRPVARRHRQFARPFATHLMRFLAVASQVR
ncbi:MAG: hypothetical protein ACI8UD_002018 [Planctomycetota bacterium]